MPICSFKQLHEVVPKIDQTKPKMAWQNWAQVYHTKFHQNQDHSLGTVTYLLRDI